jgi:hypothetical protein
MVRSVLAVLAGLFTYCLGTALLQEIILGPRARAAPNAGLFSFAVVYCIGFGVVAGFLLGLIARGREFRCATIVAGFIAMFAVIDIVVHPADLSLTWSRWYDWVYLVVAPPTLLLGGYITRRWRSATVTSMSDLHKVEGPPQTTDGSR